MPTGQSASGAESWHKNSSYICFHTVNMYCAAKVPDSIQATILMDLGKRATPFRSHAYLFLDNILPACLFFEIFTGTSSLV